MPRLSTENPEFPATPPDNGACCYHPAVRWQRRDHVEEMPGPTRAASITTKAALEASRPDSNAVRRIAAASSESARLQWRQAKRLARSAMSLLSYQATGSESDEYHKWYFNTFVWKKTTWMGVDCWKSVSDMWNYQEILCELKPSLIIEFGTAHGGSGLFFANTMRQLGTPFKVLSVDIDHGRLQQVAQCDPDITFVESSSTAPPIVDHIQRLKAEFPGKIFAILDSDHSMNHVLAEMKLLRPLLSAGDYLIVEDGNLNGHPILPGWGPGPYEAVEVYEQEFPNDYTHDVARENKFGWTFAPNGFLIRT
jgi:cephalosporin hydroxylase